MEDIKVFTYDYLNDLQSTIEVQERFEDYFANLFSYEERFPKGFSGVTLSDDFELKLPKSGNNFDLGNSILLYENLKGIHPTIASDSRLWTYMTHVRFWKYMRSRWPVEDLKDPKGRIMDRYHLKYLKLESLTRNGISRLWWYVHLTKDESYSDKYKLTKVLLSRADITVGILERSFGSNSNIRKGLLEFLDENVDIKNSEEKSRELFRQLNLLGGVKNLPFLSVDELKENLYKIKEKILDF